MDPSAPQCISRESAPNSIREWDGSTTGAEATGSTLENGAPSDWSRPEGDGISPIIQNGAEKFNLRDRECLGRMRNDFRLRRNNRLAPPLRVISVATREGDIQSSVSSGIESLRADDIGNLATPVCVAGWNRSVTVPCLKALTSGYS